MVTLNQVVSSGVALILLYLSYKFFYSGPDVENAPRAAAAAATAEPENERDLLETMSVHNKRVVVFYGSQTGTAEDLATKLSKEMSSKYGLKSMTADLDNFDYDNLDAVPEDALLVFLMASYGEGEPTDNAQEFMLFIQGSPEFSEGASELPSLQFAVFGLGNTSYEKYNQVGRDLNQCLESLGAQRIGAYGEGDDGKGTLEEDFMAWKDQFFEALAGKWGLEEREAVYEPSIEVTEQSSLSVESPDVYLGEPNLKQLVASKEGAAPKGPFTPSNPLPARVVQARELFKQTPGEDRHCVHIEFDVTGLKYTTGDHLAVWAQNSDEETTRFLSALGLAEKRNTAIAIEVLDTTSTIRVPSPTTYDTVVRFYLEVNGPVSRQVLASIAPYAPTPEAKAAALRLAGDKQLFHAEVVAKCYNLARLMLALSGGVAWTDVPFNFVIETVPHLVPRYYSISSSSLETPNTVSITAVVERLQPANADHEIWGVVTNNLLDVEQAFNGLGASHYQLQRPSRPGRQQDSAVHLPVHVRHSLFKLPRKQTLPIIMIGPGTGVAPFRGFVHERAAQVAKGMDVGKALLFYGARHEASEYLYGEEWPQHSWLDVETAFSRDGPQRVYVQDRLRARAADVNKMIDDGACVFVCGDASRMARDVHETLLDIIAEQRGVSRDDADKVLRKLRSRNKYLEDVW